MRKYAITPNYIVTQIAAILDYICIFASKSKLTNNIFLTGDTMKIKFSNLLFSVATLIMVLVLLGCNNDINTPEPKPASFKFSGITQDHRSFKVNVIPQDEEQEYIIFVSDKKHFTANQIDTREELLEDDYQHFSSLAEYYDMGLYDFLKGARLLTHGDKLGYSIVNLYPDTEYVFYCYGVEFNGDFYEATTEICYTEIRTTAPAVDGVEYTVSVDVDGDIANVSIDPMEYNGYFYSLIVPETDNYYLYPEMDFSQEYLTYYRNKLLDEFDEKVDNGTAPSMFCHKGKTEYSMRLEPNREYVLLIFTLSDDKTPIVASKPVFKHFTTKDFKAGDLNIDIAVTGITSYYAYLTVTPSNNKELYACILLSKDQVPTVENEYEQMSLLMELYEPATFKGEYSDKIFPFMPQSDYVIVAFGIDNGYPSTKLFRQDFTTLPADPGKIDITNIEIFKLFDAAEVIALNKNYAQMLGECECVAIVDVTTSAPTDKVYFWWYDSWMESEYSEEAFLEDLLMYDPVSPRSMADMYYSYTESDIFFFAGIAEDDDGNLSPIYYGDMFTLSKDMCSPASEFSNYVNTRKAAKNTTTRRMIVKL